MNKPFLNAVWVAASSSLMLAACAPTSPQIDSRFGESTRMSIAQQTLNPDAASKNLPESVDGAVARSSVDRYRTSFREPTQANDAYTIGLGSGRGR